jgi:DNA-binding IclR family transcriptional regulator
MLSTGGPRQTAPPTTRSALGRGLALLVALSQRGEARVDELAAEAGLPLSTAYRYLRQLREEGFAIENGGV